MQRKVALALLALVFSLVLVNRSQLGDHDHGFEEFKLQFGKNYKRTGEEQYRRMIFMRNKELIEIHNVDPTQTYQKGINQFADMTEAELNAMYSDISILQRSKVVQVNLEDKITGVEVDWAQAGKVGPVIDQGSCGASWAWSAIGAFESAHMIKGNNILGSAQELLDCTYSYGNIGCSGGLMSSSFKYIKEHKIHEAQDYPYIAQSEKCKTPLAGKKWTISNYTEMTSCDALLNALTFGPVSVAIDMSSLYNYKNGIVTKCGSSPSSGSLLVGVTDDYWRLKQSFSVNWGESGFLRLARGNTCAVCTVASYPTI